MGVEKFLRPRQLQERRHTSGRKKNEYNLSGRMKKRQGAKLDGP